MDRLKFLRGFPEFAHVQHISHCVASLPKEDICVDIADDIQKFIFAPDPVTGIPRSDIALTLSKDTRPEIQQYLQQVLQKPLPSGVRSMDGDTVLDMVKSRRETLTEYANRLRELSQAKKD